VVRRERTEGSATGLTPAIQETLDAYHAGAHAPAELAKVLGCSTNTAKMRRRRMLEYLEGAEE
jgi:DNA-directed RNA polymerase specialized sigma24 family protein